MKWPMDMDQIFVEKKSAAGKIFLRKDCTARKSYQRLHRTQNLSQKKKIFFELNPNRYWILLM